ncbi:MAG: hypothetical protein NC089_03725 [Bacteroides sp.]|nr:hypothetical protein [Bacteroides sp.]MCM1549724.1 hypothetical protein [Clostridium sp.]
MRGKNVSFSLMIFSFIFGAVFVYMSLGDGIRSNKTPVDFNTLTPESLESGLIVEGELPCNYGAFMEEYTTNYGIKTGSSTYTYLIPIGDSQFMAVKPHGDELGTSLEQQAEATLTYLLNGSSAQPNSVHIKGQIKALNNESLGYMRDYLVSMGYSQSQASAYSCAYYINCESYDRWWIGLIIGLAFIALSIGLLLRTLKLKKTSVTAGPVPQMSQNSSYTNFTPYNGTSTSSDDLETPEDSYTQPSTSASVDSQEDTGDKPKSGFSLKLGE